MKLIEKEQRRPLRQREEGFLELIYKVYCQMADANWRGTKNGSGFAVSLVEIHGLLTLLPGSEYAVEEFGRDLLLLDRKPGLKTKDGAAFEFEGSATARRMKGITIYDENGNERTYIAIRFSGER